jgi:hypothetical protein
MAVNVKLHTSAALHLQNNGAPFLRRFIPFPSSHNWLSHPTPAMHQQWTSFCWDCYRHLNGHVPFTLVLIIFGILQFPGIRIPEGVREFCLLPNVQAGSWDHFNSMSNGIISPEVKRQGRNDNSPPLRAEVKMRDYTITPPICFHGRERNNFNFYVGPLSIISPTGLI